MKKLWSLIVLFVCAGSMLLTAHDAGSEDRKPAVEAPPQPSSFNSPKAEEPAELPDMSAIDEMRHHEEELETKEKALAVRETELKAREQAVEDEMKKLAAARDDIAKVDDSRKKENDSKVAKLVDTVENMSPSTASQLLSTLDDSLAVATMAKISTPKLAKIMNKMEPKRAAKLSELLAGVVRVNRSTAATQTSRDVSETANHGENVKKGIKENDGKNQQQQQSVNSSDASQQDGAKEVAAKN